MTPISTFLIPSFPDSLLPQRAAHCADSTVLKAQHESPFTAASSPHFAICNLALTIPPRNYTYYR